MGLSPLGFRPHLGMKQAPMELFRSGVFRSGGEEAPT